MKTKHLVCACTVLAVRFLNEEQQIGLLTLKLNEMKKILLIIATALIVSCENATKIKTTGIVLEHHISYDRSNGSTYRTLIKTKESKVIERVGLNFYLVPIDSSCTLYYNHFEL